ncbi:MAG: 5-keto-L-gluconate epimerase [Melioribacteraceae bacterium]|nr:5-keto-L-gluconate epimerase [Melioribacteraceae bacterium]
MKLSIVLSTQPASFSALAYKGNIEENIKQIKKLGYDGVELAVRNPNEVDVEYVKSILEENNLPVPAVGTGQAFGEEGLSFTHGDPRIRRKAIERIKDQITFSKNFDAVVIIGLVRGIVGQDEDRNQAYKNMLTAFDECASFDENVKIVIEPINRYETNLLNTVEQTLQFIDELGKPNVGLLLDTFHMNIEEPNIVESIKNAKDKIFHFHVADSNRWHPGAGHINFYEIYETLQRLNYDGFVSAEILPMPDPDVAAANNIKYLKKVFAS